MRQILTQIIYGTVAVCFFFIVLSIHDKQMGKRKPKPTHKTECRQGVLYYVDTSYNRQSIAPHYQKGANKPTECEVVR